MSIKKRQDAPATPPPPETETLEQFDAVAAQALAALQRSLGQAAEVAALRGSLPPAAPIRSYRPDTWVSSGMIELSGVAGDVLDARKVIWDTFRAEALFATDSAKHPGAGTELVELFFGSDAILKQAIPTWLLGVAHPTSADFAVWQDAEKLVGTPEETPHILECARLLRVYRTTSALLCGKICQIGIPITVRVRFREACRFELTVSGPVLR